MKSNSILPEDLLKRFNLAVVQEISSDRSQIGSIFVHLYSTMRVIAVKTLKRYAKKKIEAEQSLLIWYEIAYKAGWRNHNELKAHIGHASVIGDKRVVFNIHGNKYRLIVDIEYQLQIIFIVWIGTHKQYNNIDAKTIVYVKAN